MASTSLEPLNDIEQITPFVTRILGQNPGPFTLQGTNTYLVGPPSSKSCILIDTGEGEEAYIPLLKRALGSRSISHIILTHWHHDHVDGLPSVLSLLSSLSHPPPTIHQFPSDSSPSTITPLKDGQEFNLSSSTNEQEDATLTILHTPGHTHDSISLHLATLSGHESLFTADTVLGTGTAVFEDLTTYMRSLSRLQTLLSTPGTPDRTPILPGHGPLVPDGKRKIEEYIAHREMREDEVIEALSKATDKGERRTADELVEEIYGETIPEAVRPAAARGLQLVLAKLEGEGKIRGDAEKGYEVVGEKSKM